MKNGNQGEGGGKPLIVFSDEQVIEVKALAANLVTLATQGNVAANIFYLKTQGGWKEDQPEAQDIPPINIVLDSRAADPSTD